jgi:hypothetical protein
MLNILNELVHFSVWTKPFTIFRETRSDLIAKNADHDKIN